MNMHSSSGSHLSGSSPACEKEKTEAAEDALTPVKGQSAAGKERLLFFLRTLLIDIAIGGVAICIFATFHHVIPTLRDKDKEVESVSSITYATPSPTPAAVEPTPEIIPEEPEEIVDTRTEWQKKFEDKFTDEVVVTENHYSSPDICIDIISDVFHDKYDRETKVYVADIYIGSIDCFRTYFAGGKYINSKKDEMDNMIDQSGAILAINGDFANLYTSQETFLVRNGEVFFTGHSYMCDICILNADGTVDMYLQKDFNSTPLDDILARQPYNSWRFGPSLLDADGHAKENMNLTSDSVKFINPRAALGYYEPGHYCFVACDGRSDDARGLSIWELAEYCESLGCKSAYNLDGGASAMMKFNGEAVNVIAADWRTNEDRLIGDILLIGEPLNAEEDNHE